MKRKYSKKLLLQLNKEVEISIYKNLHILVKPIPEGGNDGDLDPRIYQGLRYTPILSKASFRIKPKATLLTKYPRVFKPVFNRVNNYALHESILQVSTTTVVSTDGTYIPIQIYTKNDHQLHPIFVYIHGGGFFSGSMNVVDHLCKYLCDKGNLTVISIGYRLVPDVHYPKPLEDCFSVVEYLFHYGHLHYGDSKNLFVGGDSAGGNLAVALNLKLRDEHKTYVKGLLLNYPVVNLENHHYDLTNYHISKKHRSTFETTQYYMKDFFYSKDLLAKLYVKNPLHFKDPYASVIEDSLHDLPPTLCIVGEHDFLVFQDIEFMNKLSYKQDNYRMIFYRGLQHGFMDQLGILPQGEDAAHEMIHFIKDHLLYKKKKGTSYHPRKRKK